MGQAVGAPKVKKMQFWKIENGRQCPYIAPEKKVQETKKFSLNEFHMECVKIVNIRSKLRLLEMKEKNFQFFRRPEFCKKIKNFRLQLPHSIFL